jgi:hypothetical protein
MLRKNAVTGSIFRILDGPAQISLFAKLKLANCAPISALLESGFFCAQVRQPACALEAASRLSVRTFYEFGSIGSLPR